MIEEIQKLITSSGGDQDRLKKSIITKVAYHAHSVNDVSKKSVESMIGDIVDIVYTFYRYYDVDTSHLLLVGEIEKQIEEKSAGILSAVNDGKFEILNEINDAYNKTSIKEIEKLDDYISSYLEKKLNQIMEHSIFPWFKHSLKYKQIFPNLFVKPYLKANSNKIFFDELINEEKKYINQNIAILGIAGAGKSTLLRYTFAFQLIKSIKCIYITAKEAVMHNGILDKIIYRASLTNSKQYLVFIDGLDEEFAYNYSGYHKFITKLQEAVNIYFWLGCRTDYFEHNYNENITFIQHSFTISPWNEKQAEYFIHEYSKIKKNESINDKVEELVGTDEKIKLLKTNPFQLSLIVFLADSKEEKPILGIYNLYERFLQRWIKREKSRGTTEADNKIIVDTLRLIAHKIYDAEEYVIDTIIEKNSAIKDLLIIDDKNDIYNTRCAIAFYHRSLAAFILAQNLIEAFLLNKTSEIKCLLKHKMKDDVTNFIGNKFAHLNEIDKTKIKENLCHMYYDTHDRDLSVKEQLIYYITRLGIDVSDFLLDVIKNNPSHPIMRLTIAYGCVLSENQDIRNYALDYAKSISNNTIDAITNRAWTIIYFGDVNDRDPYTYDDNEKRSWKNARKARIKRFTKNNPRLKDYRFRLFDIPLFYSFLKDRKWNDISMDEFNVLRSVEFPKNVFNKNEIIFLKKEKRKLLDSYRRHLKSMNLDNRK